jgi:hypothetical protein
MDLYLEQNHRIEFIRYPEQFKMEAIAQIRALNPTLLLAPDELISASKQLATDVCAPLGAASFNILNQSSLEHHWREIAGLIDANEFAWSRGWIRPLADVPPPQLMELSSLAPMRLALKFLARQVGEPDLLEGLDEASEEELVERFCFVHQTLRALAEIERIGDLSASLEQHRSTQPMLPRTPLVLGARRIEKSGVTPQRAAAAPQITIVDEQLHLSMLSHRTLASNSIGLQLADVPKELVQRLRQLEELCAQSPHDLPKIWWVLDVLGREAASVLGAFASAAGPHMPSITLFSDFPLGLALVGEASAPLQFSVPVIYRPMTPVFEAVNYELSVRPQVFLRGGFRVLLAEFLDTEDPFYPSAHRAWQHLRSTVQDLPGLTFEIVSVRSVEELNAHLERSAVDVLVLSGHGGRTADGSSAGISIRGQIWLGDNLQYVPKIVVLSACGVVPRSATIANIVDRLLINGALAVIGSLVPIEFGRNANFLLRFFQNIYHSIKGTEPWTRLDQAWRSALCGSVIGDILYPSGSLLTWAQLEWDGIIEQYLRQYKDGRIRPSHIYTDVEHFLINYAADCGVSELFRKALQPRNYFPEAVFYMMIGRPERVILRDEEGEKFREHSREFNLLGNLKTI